MKNFQYKTNKDKLMKVLLLGASGATGRLVLQQLLYRNIETKIVVRNPDSLPKDIMQNKILECITGSISEFEPRRYAELISDCDAVISTLGHNITFSGMFGKPRNLVSSCIRNLCEAAERRKKRIRLILMSTTANRNTKIKENYAAADRIVLSLLRILPPHKDNIEAAKYLSYTIGDNSNIEWIAVRPDTLIDNENESRYEILASPRQSPVFHAGKTSRINVSRFYIELLSNNEHWEKWKYKMPVIYNS
jgi:putative NADH-flavin reductase